MNKILKYNPFEIFPIQNGETAERFVLDIAKNAVGPFLCRGQYDCQARYQPLRGSCIRMLARSQSISAEFRREKPDRQSLSELGRRQDQLLHDLRAFPCLRL